MATEYLFANNATTTLEQALSSTATVINVADGDGSLFPSPGQDQAFAITLVDAATGLLNEICYCTSRSGDQLTVTRGEEGTNARSWLAGDTCANYITADVIESWLQESDLDGYANEDWVSTRFEPLLGFTPVQQGGGADQTDDKVCIGNASDISGILRYRVGSTDLGPLVSGNYGAVASNGDVSVYSLYWSVSGRPMLSYGETGDTIQWAPMATYSDVTTETSDRVAAVSAVQDQLPNYVSGIWAMSGSDVQVNGLTVSGNTGRPQVFTATTYYTLAEYSDVTTETSDRVAAVSAVQSQLPNYVSGKWAMSGSDVQVTGLTISGVTKRPQVFTATTIYEMAETGDVSLMPFSEQLANVSSGSATLTFTPPKSGKVKIDYNAGISSSVAKMTDWGLTATGATYLGGAGNNAGSNLLAGSGLYSVTAGVTAAITLSVTFSASAPEVLVGGTAIFVAD